MTSHNMSQSREYKAWQRMRASVKRPTFKSFKRYGALGITICPEWESFSHFYREMGAMPENCNALDIVNGQKIFSKANCGWVTNTEGKKAKGKKKAVSILLDINQYEAIQNAAIKESEKFGKTRT